MDWLKQQTIDRWGDRSDVIENATWRQGDGQYDREAKRHEVN